MNNEDTSISTAEIVLTILVSIILGFIIWKIINLILFKIIIPLAFIAMAGYIVYRFTKSRPSN